MRRAVTVRRNATIALDLIFNLAQLFGRFTEFGGGLRK